MTTTDVDDAPTPDATAAAEAPAGTPPTATAPAGRPAAAWWRRWRWPAVVVVALVLVTVITAAVQTPPSRLRLAPDDPRPDGARAAAEILGRQGVEIAFRRTSASALAATRDAGTLFVTDPALLRPDQWQQIAASRADLVLTDVALADLAQLTEAVVTTGRGGDGTRPAACTDPDAVAAGELATGSGDVQAVAPDVVVCFPSGEDPTLGAFATWSEDGRRITVVANDRPFTNAALAEAGNAALVLRVLGRTEHLTWYVPSPSDVPVEPASSVLPPGAGAVVWWALALAFAAMLWRGRRLGPVVVEPLPVVVKAAETSLGRARLYRRAAAHGHAGTTLRAAAAVRLASRLGVPAGADRETLVAAVARASGRSAADVAALLYGPAPRDDDSLLGLVRALDSLEGEVTRR